MRTAKKMATGGHKVPMQLATGNRLALRREKPLIQISLTELKA